MLSRITMLFALALAAGLIAAGCGDDDDDTTTAATTSSTTGATGATGATGEALSQGEFTDQANQICKQVNNNLSGGPSSGQSQDDYITETFVPTIEDGLAELGQLTPPEADADAYQSLLDEGEKILDGIKQDPSSLGPDSFATFNQQAKDLGLDECGTD